MKFIEKLHNILSRQQRKADLENILQTIDSKRFDACRELYKDTAPYPGSSKYLDVRKWMADKVVEAYRLKLNKAKNLSILDIGTGAGYFPYVCNYYGHDAMALDMNIDPMYNALIELLNIDRLAYEISPYQKLPDFGKKFDLVTAYAICFNNHGRDDLWTASEWRFFMEDLANNYLKENGKVLLVLNREPSNLYYDAELLSFFVQNGAKVDNDRIYFDSVDSFK